MSVNIAVDVDVIVLSRNKLCRFFFSNYSQNVRILCLINIKFFWQHKVNMKVEKDGKKIALLVGLSVTNLAKASWMVYSWVGISNFSAINLQENSVSSTLVPWYLAIHWWHWDISHNLNIVSFIFEKFYCGCSLFPFPWLEQVITYAYTCTELGISVPNQGCNHYIFRLLRDIW